MGLMYFRLSTDFFFFFIPADPGCRSHSSNSGEWLEKNLGAFSALVSFHDLQLLHFNFSVVLAVGCHLILLSEMSVFILNCDVECLDGSLAISDSQTASRGVFHSWPAQICCPGQHGDETCANPPTVNLL